MNHCNRLVVLAIGILSAITTIAASDAPPAARIYAGEATVAMAKQNREAIEAQLANGGTCFLPAGTVAVDGSPALATGCTLAGNPRGTTLLNVGPGPTVKTFAPGLGYTRLDDITGPVEEGDWLYRFPYGKAKPQLCRVVHAGGGVVLTEPRGDPNDSFLRFRKAWPCGVPKERTDTVTLSVPTDGLVVGQWVFVTDGPSVQDAARGEHRRVIGVEGSTVRLDRRLRQSYGPAVLAWIETLENVTVRDLRIEAQPNGQLVTWAAGFKGCIGLRLERCTFAGACDVITCGDSFVTDCSGPALQLNTTVGCRIERCRFGALYCEEATSDIDVTDCEFGAGRAEPQNCVTGYFACERLRFRNTRVVGAGRAEWPPPSAFNLSGRDITLVDTEVTASRGGWTLLGGDGLVVRGFRTDGPFQIPKARRASLSQVRGPYIELVPGRADDGNVVVDASRVKVGVGWQAVAVEEWRPSGDTLPKPLPPSKGVRAILHDRLSPPRPQ